jgi:hypothetical protein
VPLAVPAHLDAGAKNAERIQLDQDGNDELDTSEPWAASSGTSLAPLRPGRFVRVGRHPLSLQRICDLTAHDGHLFAAHANQPLGTDGATITRYDPLEKKKPFTVAFDWNRFGEPAKGGGAGQGFLRVRRLDGRLFVADADPPYGGLGLAEWGTEGYVFVSDAKGNFASARPPHALPPAVPTAEKAGAGVLPRAYHVLDVIRYRGHFYASTGSVPPKEKAWNGPSPGALHVASDDLSRWTYAVDHPNPWDNGVWRLTFMVRFRDRLYAGIQDYDGRSPHDYVYFAPPPERRTLERGDAHPVRVTDRGATHTLRWFADRGRLYWIAWSRDGVRLRVTDDGDAWTPIATPPEAGAPTDIRRRGNDLLVLFERGLYRMTDHGFETLATVRESKSPFALDDVFCSAPLGFLGSGVFAGGQRDGALYGFTEDAE